MEHSYSRDWRPNDASQVATRTIMVHRPPLCPSCHIHSHDEGVDLEDFYSPPIPSYNEEGAKNAMEECEKISNNSKNVNSEDVDWEETVNKFDWTSQQTQLFDRICRIFDTDRLARLAHKERQHEPVLRRVVIDKSVQRVRQALGSFSWDPKLTQWLHGVLMDHLPSSYLAAYLDILQSLKAKVPSMVDKMVFGRPGINQDILRPILKRPWDPVVDHKSRKLPLSPIILIVPSAPVIGNVSSRLTKWYTLFSTMSSVVPVQCHISSPNKQGIEFVADQLMSMSRAKIQELRAENPQRPIILVGFNAGAALALQIALVETVSCVISMGFAYNTLHGVRGSPDDILLDITVPILFVIGQNSAKVSQEEMESIREKMLSQSSLVVVGSADELLRVGKNKRQIEGVTQTMVDNMIMDEVFDFVNTCLVSPPPPRQPLQSPLTVTINTANGTRPTGILTKSITNIDGGTIIRKRKTSDGTEMIITSPKIKMPKIRNQDNRIFTKPSHLTQIPRKAGRPRLNRVVQPDQPRTPLSHVTTEALNIAIQSILPEPEPKHTVQHAKLVETIQPSGKLMTSYEIVPSQGNTKSKLQIRQIPSTSTTTPTSSQTISGIGGTPIILPMLQRPMQKVKVIPPNQFVQLKPPIGSTQKVYTLKTAAPTTKTVGQQQQMFTVKSQQIDGRGNKIYTVKSGTQIIPMTSTSSSSTTQQSPIILNSNKFTVMKQSDTVNSKQPDLSNTSIFDIPIVFADNEGNIQETSQIVTNTTSTPIIINSNQMVQSTIKNDTITTTPTTTSIVNRNILLNNFIQKNNNKIVLINRKSGGLTTQNLITKSSPTTMPQLKYTKVMMPKTTTTTTAITTDDGASTSTETTKIFTPISVANKVETINTKMMKSPPLTPTTASATPSTTKYHPIIINVDSDNKSTMKNIIKVGDKQIKPSNTILIKSAGGGLKQIPLLKSGLLNRNLTVRKVVNIVQQKPSPQTTTTTQAETTPKEQQQQQQSPKE